MSRITPHISAFIVFVFLSACCFSQSGVAVRASIDRDKIMIGEPIELKLEARVPADTEARWFPVDSITHFEFIDRETIKFYPLSTLSGFILMRYTLKEAGRELYLYPVDPICIEGCSSKFKR